MKSDSSAIHINDLRYTWPHAKQPTLEIPEWTIDSGSRVFLYGQSGSGKSTLLNIIAGILPIKHGFIRVTGETLHALNHRQRDRLRAQKMGVIFQQFNLIPYLSVAENIGLSRYFSGQKNNPERLLLLMDQLKVDAQLLTQKANQLSVGQQQRIAVARALYHQPELIIADEPTSALDGNTRDAFIRLLLEQCALTNSTVLFVSHDQSLANHFDVQVNLQSLNKTVQYHDF
ncbi:MAG: putative ABC transport system ATP-binding protein [Kiritimatiellia bacterium]|jgi:putative ABC transport system ATP-binding protein